MDEQGLLEPDEDETIRNSPVNRRFFLKQFGSGITIVFTIGSPVALAQRRRRDYPSDLNAYLRIGENGRVSCFTGKIEMGQGIITSLAQMLAEELDIPLSSVDMVMGDTALCPYDSGTTGSRSTKFFGPPLRRAAAEAKAELKRLAAERWDIPVEGLVVKNGVIRTKDNSAREISFAQLVAGQRIAKRVEDDIPIKNHSEHTVSGKAFKRTDASLKVTGTARFAADIRVPDMLYARVLRPPAHGATLASVDMSAAETIPGVRIVEDGDLIAVLADNPETAARALQKINARYELPDLSVSNDTIFEHLQASATEERVVSENGDLAKGAALTQHIFESTYLNHYVAHAPVEPYAVLVDANREPVEVWASTQAPFRVRGTVAETLDIPAEKVHVRTPFVGGGFGGKKSGQQIVEAVRLSRLVGRPVQLAWTRKEEFFYDALRPAAVVKAKTGVDKLGRIVSWDFDIYFAGTRSSKPIYDIPHYRVSSRGTGRGSGRVHPFNTGAWRGPGSNTNVFAMESQTDIMARAAGIDPLTFRLNNLTDQRMKRVLNAAAEKFGHTFAKGPSGKGYGIACTDYLGTYVATMAEVKVDKTSGRVQVERVVCAQDMGEVINPQGAVLQIEGGITMGIAYALSEEIHFRGGKILDENFDTYEMTRFSWTPAVEAVLVDNPGMAPQGCGEPAITTVGAVIANAVYDSIGKRLFTLPMTPERIKNA
jgi:isoquinoline 1-oxidoreductase